MPLDTLPQVLFSNAPAPITSKLTKDLCNMRAILSERKRWTTGTCARDKDDNIVSTTSPGAAKFCLQGALYKSLGMDSTTVSIVSYVHTAGSIDVALTNAALHLGYRDVDPLSFNIARINDNWCGRTKSGHQKLLQVLDLAIIQSLI